jgi:poly-gamma-glutamate synthesis protein (capsule biosynthesis protein)
MVTGAVEAYGDKAMFDRMNLGIIEGAQAKVVETLDDADVDRVLGEIEKAAAFADLVLVNGHTHEPANHITEAPEWLGELGRRCIEAGAHAYLGHGPHILRGVEIHEGRPIFHSLGNFIFHRDTQDPIPAAQYSMFGLDTQRAAAHEYVAARDGSGDRLAMTGGPFYESIVPRMEFTGGRLSSMSLHPIELSVGATVGSRGTPRLAVGELAHTILERLARLSEPLGFEFSVDDGIGQWHT